jgi:hypothetical protein
VKSWVVAVALVVAACSSAPKTEVPALTPSPTPEPLQQAEPLDKSQLDADDEKYALYLEKILTDMPAGRDEKLLLNYIRYLHYRKPQFARDYVNGLIRESEVRDGLVPGINIFEAPFILCFFENQRCVKSVGDLTRKYFVPRLYEGDPLALEILVVQSGLAENDDIEAEIIQETLASTQVTKYSSIIKDIRKRHRKALSNTF